MFDTLHQLALTVGTSNIVLKVSNEDHLRALRGEPWQNQLEQGIHASLYHISEDFTRQFDGHAATTWPNKEVGAALLDLMLSNLSRKKDIRNYGNALSRCCSFVEPEFAFILWAGNCLRIVSEIDADELAKMRDYLAHQSTKSY